MMGQLISVLLRHTLNTVTALSKVQSITAVTNDIGKLPLHTFLQIYFLKAIIIVILITVIILYVILDITVKLMLSCLIIT